MGPPRRRSLARQLEHAQDKPGSPRTARGAAQDQSSLDDAQASPRSKRAKLRSRALAPTASSDASTPPTISTGANANDEAEDQANAGTNATLDTASATPLDAESPATPTMIEQVTHLRTRLAQRIMHEEPLDLFAPQLERLVALLTAGIVAGTSQSAIVVGPRGCGKSSLLRRALAAVQANKAASTRGFRLVECSALVQVDDAAAIRHIARALAIDDASSSTAAAARQEDLHAEDDLDDGNLRASAAETARALREALLAGDRATSQCLVVVLDEIDLYAHSSQQLLLYTLLDLVQSGNAPLVVIGLTCRLDVTSLFEKRVLSRFSRQQVHLQHTWDFAGYASAFAKLLRLPDEDKDSAKDTAPRGAAHAATTYQPLPAISASVREQWNTSVEAVVDNASVRRELEQLFFTSRGNLRLLQQVAMSACTAVGPDEPFLEAAHVYDGRIAQCADARVSLLLSASGLELSLVIAYSQLLHRGASSANFEQIFDTYRAFTRRIQHDGGLDLYQKPVALKAFEHLCSMELFRPADGRNYPVTDPYRAMQLMLTPPQLAEVLEKCSTLPTKVKVWAKSGGTEMN